MILFVQGVFFVVVVLLLILHSEFYHIHIIAFAAGLFYSAFYLTGFGLGDYFGILSCTLRQ